jgi:hypothetical protein
MKSKRFWVQDWLPRLIELSFWQAVNNGKPTGILTEAICSHIPHLAPRTGTRQKSIENSSAQNGSFSEEILEVDNNNLRELMKLRGILCGKHQIRS